MYVLIVVLMSVVSYTLGYVHGRAVGSEFVRKYLQDVSSSVVRNSDPKKYRRYMR